MKALVWIAGIIAYFSVFLRIFLEDSIKVAGPANGLGFAVCWALVSLSIAAVAFVVIFRHPAETHAPLKKLALHKK